MELLTRPEVIAPTVAIIGVTILALCMARPGTGRLGLRRNRPLEDGVEVEQPRFRAGAAKPDVTFHVIHSEDKGGEGAKDKPKPGPGGRPPAVGFTDVTSEHPTVTFADVAGLDEAIAELAEVREYLADPERFRRLGAELPRGIVLHGLPGCGKTLLARALAGEAKVPFYFVSAASFVEKFVGTGAARVRELFGEASRNAPAIVFIDELDAIGRRRNGDSPGEREFDNTLNQLLIELDGFRAASGVLLLGATNRLELIDAALLRPGRFDRKIQVDRPDRSGREKILLLHAAKRPMSRTVDWAEVAEHTAGLSAAELANIVNEASLLAARRHQHEVSRADVEEATARVVSGTRTNRLMTPEEKRVASVHEAGHALLSLLLKGQQPPARISLMAPAHTGSRSMWGSHDREIHTKRELIGQLIVLLGGRAAEMNVLGEPSNRAEDDLDHAATLARQMVERWAMTGRFELAGGKRDSERDRLHFEGSAGGAEVRDLLTKAEDAARKVLADNLSDLLLIADTLASKETLTAAQLTRLAGREPSSSRSGRPEAAGAGAGTPVRHLRAI
ncbi:MAG TPA: AAA family ATPase [Acidimicrobiales bacterium]|nr:AAA family ATPase [Acidimicrobiales bacterium]